MLGFKRNQQGDTIVEVLIAIAIVSLVLTIAFVITNKNTLAIQANQERIQAQHLVEAQIEALRAKGSLTTPGDCFNSAGVEVGGAANCSGSSLKQAGSGANYTASITGPTSGVYAIKVTWSSLTSNQATDDSTITMYYRLQ